MAGSNPYMALAAPTAHPAAPPPQSSAPAPSAAPAGGNAANPYMALAQAQHKATAPVDQMIRDGALQATKWAGNALEPFAKVLGAPQRAVAGAVTARDKGLGGMLAEAGHSVMASDPRDEAGLESAMHADKLKVAHPSNFGDYARNWAVDFGAQTVTDPLTLTPLKWVKSGEEAALAALRVLPGAKQVGAAVSKATAPLAKAVDPSRGVAAAMGHQKAGEFAALKNQATAFARKYTDEHPDKVPAEGPDRLKFQEGLERAFMMHEAPEQFGLNAPHFEDQMKRAAPAAPPVAPKAAPAAKPQQLFAHRTTPGMGPQARAIPFASVIDKRDIGAPPMEEAGIPHPAEAAAPASETPTRDAMAAKMAEQRTKYNDSITAHGRATEVQGIKPDKKLIPPEVREAFKDDPEMQKYLETYDHVVAPKAVQQAIYGRQKFDGFPGAPKILPKISNALKDVMFLNPIPHMKNVITMVSESPNGTAILANGLKHYAASGTTGWKQLADKVDSIGASSSFLKDREGIFKHMSSMFGDSPVGKVLGAPAAALDKYSAFSHDTLWKFDKSMRMAMYQDAKRQGLSDGQAASYILDHLIDYSNQSQLAEALHSLGAPFPHWRIASPQRQIRALAENPAAVGRIVRGEQGVNNQLPPGSPYKVNLATPIDGLARVANPATTLPYVASSLGEEWREPMRLATGKEDLQDFAKDPVFSSIEEGVSKFLPFGNQIDEALANPYHSKSDALTRTGLGIMGAYTQNDKARWTELKEFYKSKGIDDVRAGIMASKSIAWSKRGLR